MFSNKLTARIRLLRWAVPLSLAVLVVIYQLGLARWIHQAYGEQYHTFAEIFFYGIGGPLLAFLSLDFLIRWLEERETSELQSKILEETRANIATSRSINDETLQTLYAISVMLNTLKSSLPEIPSEKTDLLQEAESALDKSMSRLRLHLQDPLFGQQPSKNGGPVSVTPTNSYKEQ
jgi:signal transduction histidine kinase